MSFAPGTRLGVYEITAPLGEGGMGQVWRARDTKLDRDVAIKVLPTAFAHDADRLARFTREGFAVSGTGVVAYRRWLVYYEVKPTTGRDLWAVDMTSPDHTPRVVANTPAEEALAQLSPDGRWVAYQTNESGRFEVVVQPFPDAGGKWQVSTEGGAAPRWRADGKELYFLAPDATLMAVPVTVAGTSFEAGRAVALFPTRIVDGGTVRQNRPQYAVARDGRFLINQPVGDATVAPITLILNWQGGLSAREK